MKTILSLLVFLFSLPILSFGQGVSVRALDGMATNLTVKTRLLETNASGRIDMQGDGLLSSNRMTGRTVLITNGMIYADGSGLTNVSGGSSTGSVSYASIAAMVADTGAPVGTVAYVYGYWGTNTWGHGWFDVVSTITGSTNLGTQFASGSTYRKRHQPEGQNVFRLEWFGVSPVSSGTPSTIHSDELRITNAIATTPDMGKLIFPSMNLAAPDIWISNRYGLLIEGDTQLRGAHLILGENAPVMTYLGSGGTNAANIHIIDSEQITIRGIGIHTETPSTSIRTNLSWTGIDIDQSVSSWPRICTANTLDGVTIRTLVTNTWWNGVWLSRKSRNNVEAMRILEPAIYGGTGSQGNGSTNYGVGIHLGDSANLIGAEISYPNFAACRSYVYTENGNFTLKGGFGTGAAASFRCVTWLYTPVVDGFTDEHSTQFAVLGDVIQGGSLTPFVIRNCGIGTDETPTNVAVISMTGSVKLQFDNNSFSQGEWAGQIFKDTEGDGSTRVFGGNNKFPTGAFTGFQNLDKADAEGVKFGRNNTTLFTSIDATYGTNFNYSQLFQSAGAGNPGSGRNFMFHVPLWGDGSGLTNLDFTSTHRFPVGIEIGTVGADFHFHRSGSDGRLYIRGMQNNYGGFSFGTTGITNQFVIADNEGGGGGPASLNHLVGIGTGVPLETLDVVGNIKARGDVGVNDDPYDATGWNGSTNVPTKNAVRDKIESIIAGSTGGIETNLGSGINNTFTNLHITIDNSGVGMIGGRLGSGFIWQTFPLGDNLWSYTPTSFIVYTNFDARWNGQVRGTNYVGTLLVTNLNQGTAVAAVGVTASGQLTTNSVPGGTGVTYWYTNNVDAITNTSGFAFINDGSMQNLGGTWRLSGNSVSTLPDGVDLGTDGFNYIHREAVALNNAGLLMDSVADSALATNQWTFTKPVSVTAITATGGAGLIEAAANLTLDPTNTAGHVIIGHGKSLIGRSRIPTNGVADATLVALDNVAWTNHTANLTIAGFVASTVDLSGTNFQWGTVFLTNNSVGVKTITLPATWQDLGLKGNPVYNTNNGVLSVSVIHGVATNYLWVGK